jgi:hypothetical protein
MSANAIQTDNEISYLSHWLFVILSTPNELQHAPNKQLQVTATLTITKSDFSHAACDTSVPGCLHFDQKLYGAFIHTTEVQLVIVGQ